MSVHFTYEQVAEISTYIVALSEFTESRLPLPASVPIGALSSMSSSTYQALVLASKNPEEFSAAISYIRTLSETGMSPQRLAEMKIICGQMGLKSEVCTNYNTAQNIHPVYRDPLILDLDGDGIETIGMSLTNPILFDHDGDGLKTGTGWIKPDDGFLVMDSQTVEIHSYAALRCSPRRCGVHEKYASLLWICSPCL